jgi:hypothetical protein
MREMLEYYVTGHAPPAPGNVKGQEVSSQTLAGGKVKYRLVHLTFGPDEKLFLDIGIYTPTTGGPFAAVVMPEFGSPPGRPPRPIPRAARSLARGQPIRLPRRPQQRTVVGMVDFD